MTRFSIAGAMLSFIVFAPPDAHCQVRSGDVVDTAQFIDQQIDKQLSAANIPASPACSDSDFLRRLCLDLHGRIPTADQARQFLDDTREDKRARLIDARLAHEDYGIWMGDVWLHRLFPERSSQNKVKPGPLREWLTAGFNQNRPWNALSYDLLTGTGEDTHANPAVTVFLNDSGTLKPEEAADLVVPVFLGVKIECAQCHDHPFNELTQDDYWGMAAFFTKLVRDGKGTSETRGLVERVNKKLKLPPYAKEVPAKFLGGAEPELDPDGPYRPTLARWITAEDNPYFARAIVNRVWAHFFGLGIVNPVDDMDDNRPSHPKLLSGLAERFVASGYDMKYLVGSIVNSAAYQRSLRPVQGNEKDAAAYGRKPVRLLTPLELFDSLKTLGIIGNHPPHKLRVERRRFAHFFQAGDDPLDYDRGIPQLLLLMNSKKYNASQFRQVQALVKQLETADKVLEAIYLSILSRRPTEAEHSKMTALLDTTTSRTLTDSATDIYWVLLNTSEFRLR